MTNIYFLRHGAVYNPKNIIYGKLEYVLSADGVSVIKKVTDILTEQNIQIMYSSPLLRCIQTANIVANNLGLAYTVDNRLTESEQLEQWEGLSVAEIKKKDPEDWYKFRHNPSTFKPNGISLENVAQRMFRFVEELLSKHKQENILCVSHGDPIKSLWCLLEHRSYDDIRILPLNYGGSIKMMFKNKNIKSISNIFNGEGDFHLE